MTGESEQSAFEGMVEQLEENIPEGLHDKKPEQRKRKYFLAQDFDYDEDENRCWCPAGKEMWLCNDSTEINGLEHVRFEGYLNDCRQCPLVSQCMRNGVKARGRQVSIRKDNPGISSRPIDRMKRKIDTSLGRAIYSERIGIIEPIFAHIKHIFGLDWFSLRGRSKVKGQWLLFCMVHNLVKIQRYDRNEAV